MANSIHRLWPLVLATLVLYTTSSLYSAERKLNNSFVSYIHRHHAEAVRQMERHQVPASITIAQGIVETGAGKSTLASEHNNHFGIKCHRNWTGRTTYRTDDAPNECFRSYRSWQESYEDHSLFLKNKRYQRLFSLPIDDYTGWARGLQQAGYATNKGYANMLIKVIEDYELYSLDRGRLPSYLAGASKHKHQSRPKHTPEAQRAIRPIYRSYGLLYVLANAGESLDTIADELDISASKLAKYNEVPENFSLQEGDIIYLERKNRSATRDYRTHTVGIGDSMHKIAQRYGMRIDRLYKLNDKDDEYVPQEGDLLKLR